MRIANKPDKSSEFIPFTIRYFVFPFALCLPLFLLIAIFWRYYLARSFTSPALLGFPASMVNSLIFINKTFCGDEKQTLCREKTTCIIRFFMMAQQIASQLYAFMFISVSFGFLCVYL